MNHVIIAQEKGLRVIGGATVEEAASKLVKERLQSGNWYLTKAEQIAAQKALSNQQCWSFLRSRRSYEYESVELYTVE